MWLWFKVKGDRWGDVVWDESGVWTNEAEKVVLAVQEIIMLITYRSSRYFRLSMCRSMWWPIYQSISDILLWILIEYKLLKL